MLTKDDLLKKGIDPAVVDEILASAEEDQEDSRPLEALHKALDGVEMPLFKAGGEGKEDEEDEDEYDEEYMKKYFKKYMKANKKDVADTAKELGLFKEEMKKAIEDIDLNTEGAVIEMAELSAFLEAQTQFNEKLAKAFDSVAKSIAVIANQNTEHYSLLHKAAAVIGETAEQFEKFAGVSQGRKGAVILDLKKAKETAIDTKAAWKVLTKAVSSGDVKAGEIGSRLESSKHNYKLLSGEDLAYVNELIAKEAK